MTDPVTQTVTKTVIGSANPIAVRFRALGKSLQGIGCGIVLLIVGVVMIYQSVNGVTEYSKIVGALSLKTPDQVTTNEDLVKVSAKTDNVTAMSFSYTKYLTKACDAATNTIQQISSLLHYQVDVERFEVVKNEETETETSVDGNGNEVETKSTKITYTEEWVKKGTLESSASFYIGNIKIVPSSSTRYIADMSETTIDLVKTDNFINSEGATSTMQPLNNYGQTVSDTVGTVRFIVHYLPVSDVNFIVVGSYQNGQITSGDPFIITNKSDAELISNLQASENLQRTAFMVIAWICMFIGLSALLAPLIELASFIPFAGNIAKAVAGVVAFIVATIITLSGWLLIKFWWVFVILFVAIIAFTVYLVVKKKDAPKK